MLPRTEALVLCLVPRGSSNRKATSALGVTNHYKDQIGLMCAKVKKISSPSLISVKSFSNMKELSQILM